MNKTEITVLPTNEFGRDEDELREGSSWKMGTYTLQVPKLGWQNDPQWSILLPQKPYREQQFPYVEFWQVSPAPQRPVVLIVRLLVGGATEEVVFVVVEDDVRGFVVVVVVGLGGGEDDVDGGRELEDGSLVVDTPEGVIVEDALLNR